jgi:hypothetical protein
LDKRQFGLQHADYALAPSYGHYTTNLPLGRSHLKQQNPQEHANWALANEAIYGIPELHAARIKAARIVANPGCFSSAGILALTFTTLKTMTNAHTARDWLTTAFDLLCLRMWTSLQRGKIVNGLATSAPVINEYFMRVRFERRKGGHHEQHINQPKRV